MTRRFTCPWVFLLIFLVCASSPAQDDTKPGGKPGGDGKKGRDNKDEIKPYDEVITAEAKSDPGLFTVHRLKDKTYFEISPSDLGRDFLWVTQISKTQSGFGYAGTPVRNRVVRWELRDKEILLRDVKYRLRSEVAGTVSTAVDATSVAPIIRSFPVKAWGRDKAPVVDVTSLYLDDLPEFSAKQRLSASGADRKRSYIEVVKSFPGNIEAKVLMTYKLSSSSAGASTSRRPPRGGSRRDGSQSGVTVQLHHSMVALPEDPMEPRRHDKRVGFFTVSFEDYGASDDRHEVEEVRYITRWRLEKKNPGNEISDPKKPIVFHVGRGVPEKWRPWVRRGIESWQPAFEKAGFSRAIIARDAPTVQEDPDWDAEDARISTIRWMPSTTENAMGPHVHDPRTGEILEADIIMYHNVIKLVRDWYFVQASPMDKRAQTLPMPDDLIGELLAYVVAHEVGHSLGFPHNMKASSSYSVEQLRNAEFTRVNGNEASIMDYGRFNYVAQPGDGARLIPIIGPYDHFAVEWGYRRFSAATETENLETIVARQLDDPKLFFGGRNSAEDPSQQTEDLGSDPIAATEMGLKNIDRVSRFLVEATCREGEDYDLLRNMYDQLVRQRDRELMHVANVIGGMVQHELWFGDGEHRFESVVTERQRQALAFLEKHAFQVPANLVDVNILRRLESSGAADRFVRGQKQILGTLINSTRIKRMAETASMLEDGAYHPSEMLSDLRLAIWSELREKSVSVDLYRRNLQRAHVDALIKASESKETDSDLPALGRGELKVLLIAIREAISQGGDQMARTHLDELAEKIDRSLDPRGVGSARKGSSRF